jgi:molybdopterin synthase catalytic subunit/molybdopterin synthase sulfur carrier subunit
VRLFAAARQAAGRDCLEVQLPDGATVARLRCQLAVDVPRLSALLRHMMFAVDARYVADDALRPPGS